MCAMNHVTHSYMRHNPFVYTTCLIHMTVFLFVEVQLMETNPFALSRALSLSLSLSLCLSLSLSLSRARVLSISRSLALSLVPPPPPHTPPLPLSLCSSLGAATGTVGAENRSSNCRGECGCKARGRGADWEGAG